MNTQDMKDYRPPLTEKLSALAKEGYEVQFNLEDGALTAGESDKHYQPKDLTINEEFRFEGETNPSDMSILYAVETNDGTKGTVVDAYGTYSDRELANFMKKAKDETGKDV